MALEKGINSFADVSEFDAYFADRFDVDAAITATADQKSQALVSATDMLNELTWTGAIADVNQSLAFPRVGSYFDPRVGYRVSLSEVPKRVVQATLELAYHLLINEGLQDATGLVKDLQVGPINLTNVLPPPKIPLKVKNIIRPILVNAGSSSWWRAN
jgi:hypothetical protein